ncbi:ead/Ea22-like family protein [Escherichia coli]|uniref:ead/Ea22-like family protein n=1 Tax=Escherichia coli TaxID=562 RepID=UPI0038969C81
MSESKQISECDVAQRRQPVSEINYQALREAAERAIPAMERLLMLPVDDDLLSEQELKDYGVDIDALNAFKFLTGPETVLALLDERERNQQYIKRRDQENEDIALTVGKLRVELEGKDSKIANLTAERDALREGEMGDARHSNTRAAADIYFQLVEECEIPAGGSLVEYVDDMREKLEAAEKRIAELESDSQAQKLVEAIIVAIENEQERLFDEDYLMDSKECIDVIREEVKRWNDSRTAVIRIKGGE